MSSHRQRVSGVLQTGHRIASGLATDSPYPYGTIPMRTPHFGQRGLDLSPYFPGTLNVTIAPYGFSLRQPAYTFEQVKWSPHHAPESFSFASCQLQYRQICYEALIIQQRHRAPGDRETLDYRIWTLGCCTIRP